MKATEDNKTWISNILLRNIFLCLKQVYWCLTFVCVYIADQNHTNLWFKMYQFQSYKAMKMKPVNATLYMYIKCVIRTFDNHDTM